MAYLALYRKLRPQTFEQMVGQKHIVKTLKNQILNNRVSHAYLFCGTRGTGKTSTAKIFARAVNCMGDKETAPCNHCQTCSNILSGKSINVVEIDAASNNGVDNIREITEEVKYPPTEGKYKVYIIDEVHMLSPGAFNALLKTLEEPPEHVIFILATTDPQKLPVTILSRCQRFDFHRISSQEMTDVLQKYMAEEKVDIEPEALNYIAEISDGAMRDALSILDQCMSFYYGETITMDKVTDITGSVDRNVFFDLTQAVIDNNSSWAMEIIDNLILKGRDVIQFCAEYVKHLRNLLVAVSITQHSSALDYSQEYIEKLKNQAMSIPYEYLLELIGIYSDLQTQLKYSSNPRILLEVYTIKACSPVTVNTNGAFEKRLSNIEARLEKGMPAANNVNSVVAPQEKKPVIKVEKAIPEDIKAIIKHWREFAPKLDNPLRSMITSEANPAYLEDEYLTIVCNKSYYSEEINNKYIDMLKNELLEWTGKEFKIKAMSRQHYDIRHRELYGDVDDTLPEISIEEKMETTFGDMITYTE